MSARRRARAALALACGVGLLGSSKLALAYHDDEEHLIDDTAWTLQGDQDWLLGFFRLDFAPHDRLTVGTYHWLWLFRVANLNAKWRFYAGDAWQWAARASFFRLDTSQFDSQADNPPVITLGTLELASSVALAPSHQLSQSLVYTGVRVLGDVTADTIDGLAELGATNLQYVAAYELRLSRTLALVVTGRYLLAQLIEGQTDLTLRPDAFTTIEVVGAARDDQLINFENAFSIAPALAWSWQTFNLRLGLSYGNFNVPGINFTTEERVLFPQTDLFWRF